MYRSERKTTSAISTFMEMVLSSSSTSKEQFATEYKKFCCENSKTEEFYPLVLTKLQEAISEDNIESFEKLSTLIDYTSDLESKVTLRDCYDNTAHPIRNTNLVILASKHNGIKILRYLVDSDSKLLDNLSVGIGKNSISPKDEDEVHHNAFYYAIRSESIPLLDTLITNKYFNTYFADHSKELEEILSKTYEELQLKNVPLSGEMQYFVEHKLIDLRFFSTGQHASSNTDVVTKTHERIELLLQTIALLKEDNLNTKKIDGKFLFIAKFIAQNIHILKGRLRSSYDRIPWEEMEFCLIIFIFSQTRIELNIFYRAVLNTEKILNHLENFANKLRMEEDITKGDKLYCLPRGPTREEVIKNIIKTYPQFKELYDDYNQIRDIYSLKRINEHIKLALLADAHKKQEQLVIIRVLQVIGEHLKSTLESPKLSHSTSEHLVLSLPHNARGIIMLLRDAISHSETLSTMMEIEKHADVSFFINIQNDVRKVGDVINDILYKNNMKAIRLLLEKVIESESLDEIKEIVLDTTELDTTIIEDYKTMQHEKLEKLIKELRDNIVAKTNYENELFNKINSIISSLENQTENARFDYHVGYAYLQTFNVLLNYNNYTNLNLIKMIKSITINKALKNFTATKKANLPFEEIIQLLMRICQSVQLRVEYEKVAELIPLIIKIISIIEFETTDIEWIEELREKFPKRKQKKTKLCQDKIALTLNLEDQYSKDLEPKLQELKAIISNNSLDRFKSDQKLQTVVKMLVLDIMVMLDFSEDYLENNQLFLDDNTPLLHGKCLRNYLAHDNVLIGVLFSDPLTALILNAEKLTNEEDIIKTKKKVGKLVSDDPVKLRKKFHQDLNTICNQEIMFVALEEGDLSGLEDCIKKGADIKARSTINSWTALHFAAKGPSLEVVRFVLGKNLSVNVKDNNGETPLHVAAAHGRQDIVEFFLRKTDVVDVPNNKGKTALHFAAQNGHKDVVEVLSKNKADIFTEDGSGWSALHYAVRNNHIDVVKSFMRKNLNFDVYQNILHEAAFYGHLELVNNLVANGADINATSDLNEVPLHLATHSGHLEIANALIRLGANVNVQNIHGWMPLHIAVHNGNVKMVNTLLTHGAHVNAGSKTPLHIAVKFKHLEIVAVLLNHGADINAKFNNLTPLHYAARDGHGKVVEFLIQTGAQINPLEDNKPTALQAAVTGDHQDVADLLIKNNAKVNAKSIKGNTAMHIAARNDNKEIIDLLIKNKGDVNARCCDGCTPLHFAVKEGKDAAIDFLIKNKANVNEKNNAGMTPLHVAVLYDHKEIVKLLLDNNAQVKLEYIGDGTPQPLHVAVLGGHKDIVEILIAKEANINDKYEGVTPLLHAIKTNHKVIVEILIKKGADFSENDMILPLLSGLTDIAEILIKNTAYDVNHKQSYHYTPLHTAAYLGHKKLVKVLIANGADVHAISVENETPLFCAAHQGYDEIVEILIAHQSINRDNTPLRVAAERGHSKVVKVLLENKVNDDIIDCIAPIRFAVARGHLQVVKIFLEYMKVMKVNIEAKCENDTTLLHVASRGTNLELVRYLVDEGLDINATTSDGYKAIHVAAIYGFKEGVEFFIGKGLSVNELSTNNVTLLHCAARYGKLEMVNYLIEEHADVNAKDSTGCTPMHLADIGGYKDVVELLQSIDKLFKVVKRNSSLEVQNCISAGAIVNAKNTENVTPLHYAAWKGYDEVARVLLQNKANPNAVNSKGLTPLHYAAKFSHLKVVKTLLSYHAVYNPVSDGGKTPSDLTEEKSIIGLFKSVSDSFDSVANDNSQIIKDLNKIEDIATIKAIMCASNKENKTLVVAAMHSNFSKVQQLKEIAQGDIAAQINEALKLCELHHYQEALFMYKDAFNRRKEILGSDNPGTLDIQKHIGHVLSEQGDYQEALNVFEKISQKQKEILEFESMDTLNTRRLIAVMMNKLGKKEKALPILQEIGQKRIDLQGSIAHDEGTIMMQWEMALILNEEGKHEEALNIFRSLYRSTKPDNHIKALPIQCNIASLLQTQKNYEQAMHIYEEIFEKAKVVFGLNHSITLQTLANIGEILFKQKKYNKALEVLKKLLNIQKRVLKPNHPDISRTQFSIGNVFFAKHNFVSALKVYSEAFDQMKEIFGSNHPNVLNIVKRIEWIKVMLKFDEIEPSEYIQYFQKNINIATIQKMLEHTVDSNDKDQHRRTPLHYAISNGHLNAVNILLEHGADVTLVSNEGNTSLHIATFSGHKEIAEILLRNVNPDKLNSFINAKSTDSGATSLHVAAMNGSLDIVMILLKRGAIYNITNNKGQTPLDLCEDLNISKMLKLVEELFQNADDGKSIVKKLIVLKPDEYVAIQNVRNNQNYTLSQVFERAKRRNVRGSSLQ